LRAATSKGEQLEILDGMLSDAVAYLMNIHARFLFEEQLYQIRRDGEVPAARLSEMMLAAQQEAFMDGLAADGWNPNFWISKLHFYFSGVPFYNFPYTFGYLLSLGIYALGADGGDGFPEQYRRLLRATGCQDAEDAVLATFGYDLSDAQFWHKSLDVVEQRVERFLRLLE
jgi:oligoendopeptidase F